MGRGRVELKRIENKTNRQMTFTKRRNGLLKKARELSILCDVEVALIIFSPRRRLFEFCSSSSMLQTIERYQKYCYAASKATDPRNEIQPKTYEEYLKLKARVEVLQRSQSNLLGEELNPLCAKELCQLENQLAMSLKQIRTRKTQVLLDQLCDLKRKQQVLKVANKVLEEKLQEPDSRNPMQFSWEGGGGQHSEKIFHPLLCEPQLQIGYNPVCIDPLSAGARPQNVSGYYFTWMG